MISNKFGKWTILSLATGKHHGTYYKCQCDCGTLRVIRGYNLTSGHTTCCSSCTGNKKIKHDRSRSLIYYTWQAMMARCYNTKNKDFIGDKIKVDERWHVFENFYEDMGEKPIDSRLERINNKLNYSKSNCRWYLFKNGTNCADCLCKNHVEIDLETSLCDLLGFCRRCDNFSSKEYLRSTHNAMGN